LISAVVGLFAYLDSRPGNSDRVGTSESTGQASPSQKPHVAGTTLSGTWTTTDHDGSKRVLKITQRGSSVDHDVIQTDDGASECDGNPVEFSGLGVLSGDTLRVDYEFSCVTNAPPAEVIENYRYNADKDSLTDGAHVDWKRG
jgi:hypothetical protein